MGLSSIKRKTLNFLHTSRWIQLGFIPAWLLLGVVKAIIFTILLKRLAPRLGVFTGTSVV